MKLLDNYINDKKIIYAICKIRAKYAIQRKKKQLLLQVSISPHLQNKFEISPEEAILNDILPSRRKWKKPDIKTRYPRGFQKINSFDYNVTSLLITIAWYEKNKPQELFLINLHKFIKEVKDAINDDDFCIEDPRVFPKLKGSKKSDYNVCRPISIFGLKDRLIIGAVNKYFTDLFDQFFYDYSLAFKSAKIINGKNVSPSHHDAVKEIIKYKARINQPRLWVAESDMTKFFDTVNHKIIKQRFKKLVMKTVKTGIKIDERAIRIFYKYLDCYSFTETVRPLNQDIKYWLKHNINGGKFEWVKRDLLKLKYYKKIGAKKIGIPQGGSLSGLIANIVLDYADQKVLKVKDSKLGYFRFCDDMIILHPKRKKCVYYTNKYIRALKKLKLILHPFTRTASLENTSNSFWSKDVKSKGPYKWSSEYNTSFPWIGFVGYEIHFDNLLRVRKSSLKKELKKQKEIVTQILRNTKSQRRPNIKNATIIESATKKMLGMSIGRGSLWNMNKIEHEMCWAKGYSEINDNKYSRKQLKLLDWNRNHQLKKLQKELNKFDDRKVPSNENKKNREIVYYGKPFSYFYHLLEKKSQIQSSNEQVVDNNK